MTLTEPIQDPLGNIIYFAPFFFILKTSRDHDTLKHVVTDPAFVITIKNEGIYFFKPVEEHVNLVIETRYMNEKLVVTNCYENPSVNYISNLLKKGGLVSFSYS